MKFALALSLLVTFPAFAGIIFSDAADIDKAHTDIHLYDVQFAQLPSKTEIRQIPGCWPSVERHPSECQEEVVTERRPAVVVDVKYKDGIFYDPQMGMTYLTLNLRPEAFSEESLNELKKHSGRSLDLSGRKMKARLAWAKANIELKTTLVVRDIQVIDYRNSNFCHYTDDRYPDHIPGCVEVIKWVTAKKTFREVKVLVK